jgi:hypothetical protein
LSLRAELKPKVVFSLAFTTRLKQKSSKVVCPFKGAVLVADMVALPPSCGGKRNHYQGDLP